MDGVLLRGDPTLPVCGGWEKKNRVRDNIFYLIIHTCSFSGQHCLWHTYLFVLSAQMLPLSWGSWLVQPQAFYSTAGWIISKEAQAQLPSMGYTWLLGNSHIICSPSKILSPTATAPFLHSAISPHLSSPPVEMDTKGKSAHLLPELENIFPVFLSALLFSMRDSLRDLPHYSILH